jgi:hypothetical protein
MDDVTYSDPASAPLAKKSIFTGFLSGNQSTKVFIGLLYIISILLAYLFLHIRLRPHDVDDGWSLSYLYNYFHKGITGDLNFGDPLNGVQFFGKLHALLAAFILDGAGWTRTNGHLLSLFFMGSALILWFILLKALGQSRFLAGFFCLTAFLLDPFFTAASSTRLEAFEFFVITLALTAFIYRWWASSMFLAWLAIESHPIGVMAFFYMGAALASSPSLQRSFQEKNLAILIRLALGFLSGAALFVLLHQEALPHLPGLLIQKNLPQQIKSYGPLFEYFFLTKYLRHLPELLLFLAALFFFFKKGIFHQNRFTLFFLISTLVAGLLIRRPNFHYALFFYPPLLLLALTVAEALKILPILSLGLWLFLMPQYLLVYIQNRSYDFPGQVRTLSTALPDDGLPVVANANEWFAFYRRHYFYYDYLGNYRDLGLREFYLIEDDNFRSLQGAMKRWLHSDFTGVVWKRLTINGQVYEIKKCRPFPGQPPSRALAPETSTGR